MQEVLELGPARLSVERLLLHAENAKSHAAISTANAFGTEYSYLKPRLPGISAIADALMKFRTN
jgi:hypothetical protein